MGVYLKNSNNILGLDEAGQMFHRFHCGGLCIQVFPLIHQEVIRGKQPDRGASRLLVWFQDPPLPQDLPLPLPLVPCNTMV